MTATTDTPAPEEQRPNAPEGGGKGHRLENLKKLAVRGSIYELAGFGASQVVRLFSNLILSRLLFPEAFGLAALIAIFNTGLVMLSDVGIEQSVVQNDRGDEESFLNTAWVLHITRGGLLWVLSCLLAFGKRGKKH
jgi:O-antigen/teichoic acid export membrane protein